MTARVQSLRSSVTGARPTGRLPGELYVNFVDKQLGVVDAANIAQDLIAVRFFSPTANYSRGDMVVNQGRLWSAVTAITAGAWNPSQWDDPVQASDRLYGTTAFEPTLDFAQGDLVVYNSRIWKAKTAVLPGAWNAANWELLTPPVGVVAWALTDSYAANALVSYQGKVYRAKAAVASGTFNPAEWEDINTDTLYTLPIATTGAIGGVKATAPVTGQFVTGINASGDLTFAAPTYTLPAATTTALGGIKTVATPPTGQFINGFAADGTAQYAAPTSGGDAYLGNTQSFTKAQRGTPVAGTGSFDFAAANNFSINGAGAAVTVANPTNVVAGQSGAIVIDNAASVAFGTNFKFEGGTTPTGSGAGKKDVLVYYVISATDIAAKLVKGV